MSFETGEAEISWESDQFCWCFPNYTLSIIYI